MELSEKAVFKTLIYADIFKFPLTIDEIWLYLISPKAYTKKDVKEAVLRLLEQRKIFRHKVYYGLEEKSEIYTKRERNSHIHKNKIKIAEMTALELSYIPSLLFVGISGGVSVGNAGESDDIDFFIVSKKNTIWVTRLLCILKLKKLGLLRGRNDKNVKDKICLNMFVTEDFLKVPVKKQDLYIAHEISQLLPLVSKENIYEKLVLENIWTRDFLPNFKQRKFFSNTKIKKNEFSIFYHFPLSVLAKVLQKFYMNTHHTNETISDNILAFHPNDYRKIALSSYYKKLVKYNLSQ